jgi:putative transposase
LSLLVEIPFMARPLRIEYPGAYYHVSTRGNERKAIFRDDVDREKFLELIGRAVEQFGIRVHAYVLMDRQTLPA